MRRRTLLRTVGIAAAAGTAGCIGGGDSAGANEYGYDTETTDGVEVPLVPLEDVIQWYRDDEDTVFADARDETAFDRARIAGAVFSPAPDGQPQDDPLSDLPEETRIVTYCVCPHHLSTMRGATLIENGYANTYAIDEGFQAWIEAGYPVEGTAVQERPAEYRIDGRTDPAHAGDYAWARHPSSGQREAVPIEDDGSFTLHLRFHEVDEDSRIELDTPAGTETGRIEEFQDGSVDLR